TPHSPVQPPQRSRSPRPAPPPRWPTGACTVPTSESPWTPQGSAALRAHRRRSPWPWRAPSTCRISAWPDCPAHELCATPRPARSYLDQAGATGTVDVLGPGVVQVSVTVTASTPLLGIPVSQTRTHTAQLQVGVTHGEGLQ